MAEASITPGFVVAGESLSGRSSAPVAAITRALRMRQRRWRGVFVSRSVIGDALIGEDIAVVIDTGDHGAQPQMDIIHPFKGLHRCR